MQNFFTWLYMIFWPNIRQLWETAGYYIVQKHECQTISVKAAAKSCYRLHWHPSCVFDIDLSPCHANIQSTSQQRVDASLHECYVMICCFIAFGGYTKSFWEFISEPQKKNFNSKKINPISGYENLSSYSREYLRQLIAEKWLFEFSTYSSYIFEARWTKSKISYFKLLQDFVYQNCSNRFIFDWVVQKIIRWRFWNTVYNGPTASL